MTAPRMHRFGIELAANFIVVVDFAVEYHNVTVARREHRLMPRRRQIDNGQTALGQHDTGLGVPPYTVIVGPPMPDQVSHSPHERGIMPRRSGAAEKANDSTHIVLSFTRISTNNYYRRPVTKSRRGRTRPGQANVSKPGKRTIAMAG